jgi:hypothetical protein
MSVDAIELLFRKLRTHDSVDGKRRPYLFLIQHSLAFQLRQQASSGMLESDETVYRRAGLRTPSENALRDLEGGALWTKYVTLQMCAASDTVVWLRTSTRRLPLWLQKYQQTHVIDAAKDPFGWNEGTDSSTTNMEDLNSIVSAVESLVQKTTTIDDGSPYCCGLVIESLTPILQRHGLDQTVRLIRKLRTIVLSIVISVVRETLSPCEHRVLEDLAEAILCIQEGDATLLRKGVRERDNVVREILSFQIVTDQEGQRNVQLVDADVIVHEEPQQPKSAAVAFIDNKQHRTHSQTSKSRPKVELRLEEGDRQGQQKEPSHRQTPSEPSETSAAHIYMDDDDPEFDDYDEEDPDDDLDI